MFKKLKERLNKLSTDMEDVEEDPNQTLKDEKYNVWDEITFYGTNNRLFIAEEKIGELEDIQ